MTKNVVILSDGTGQGASMPAEENYEVLTKELTNIGKLWHATKDVDPARQIIS
jgi:hypothetical protein